VPLMQHSRKNYSSFIIMQSSASYEMWMTMTSSLKKKLIKYAPDVPQQLFALIETALVQWRTNKQPIKPQYLGDDLDELFLSQSSIGWDQILKGRFTHNWLSLISLDNKFATRVMTYIIKNIWHIWFEIWKFWCDINQGQTPNLKTIRQHQRLYPRVQHLYDEVDNIDPSDSHIFKYTQEDLLSQKPHEIKRWINTAKI
jgi:hypothetical protein